jgi:hypothetical protein
VLRTGIIFVEATATAAVTDPVYVETADGASSGKFYTTASSTRVYLPPNIARWPEPGGLTGDGTTPLNVLQLAAA